MADINDRVRLALEELIGSGVESGLQVAAYHHGELVVDSWAGLADVQAERPVDGDTLFTSFSCTKGVTATAIHMLVDRGVLSYDEPIANHWPQFAQRGKQNATIRHALTHRVGVPQMPEGITPEAMANWDYMCEAIAALEPLWEPGSQTGYHAYTFGWILGEIIRRVDGRPINQFVQEEICVPLGLDGIHMGVDDANESRVATLVDGPRPDLPPSPPDALITRAIPPAVGILAEPYNKPLVRRAALPAHGGLMNARSLARMYAALGNGGVLDGVRVLPEERVRIATSLQTDDLDLAIQQPVRKALGYFQSGPISAMGPRTTTFGHPGAGGAIGFADPEHGFAFALTKSSLVAGAEPGGSAVEVIGALVRRELGFPDDETG
ncbi:MAG TPA: serine hydrolase [Dehalococcoidia bacterium]|nr:serine hydrolase [Dehalococcoidia bacterium]|tara:strand:+ start:772 stop:1911 length:1140 start_codon:yes stop_codon:yes gene_type:complete